MTKHTFNSPHSRSSPWGVAQTTKMVAPGIQRFDTASHGGYKLSQENELLMPKVFRKNHWYEEDADWAIVAYFFPQAFPPEAQAPALDTIKNWHPYAWEQHSGEALAPGESYLKDQDLFAAAHAADWVAIAAWGDWADWVPESFTGVCATLGGRRQSGDDTEIPQKRYFLVPEAEYDQRGRFGFVIQAHHQEVANPNLPKIEKVS